MQRDCAAEMAMTHVIYKCKYPESIKPVSIMIAIVFVRAIDCCSALTGRVVRVRVCVSLSGRST